MRHSHEGRYNQTLVVTSCDNPPMGICTMGGFEGPGVGEAGCKDAASYRLKSKRRLNENFVRCCISVSVAVEWAC